MQARTLALVTTASLLVRVAFVLAAACDNGSSEQAPDAGARADSASGADSECAAPTCTSQGDAAAPDGAADTGMDAGADALSTAPCAAGDPQRLFWNDFEDARYFAPDGSAPDPTRDF